MGSIEINIMIKCESKTNEQEYLHTVCEKQQLITNHTVSLRNGRLQVLNDNRSRLYTRNVSIRGTL